MLPVLAPAPFSTTTPSSITTGATGLFLYDLFFHLFFGNVFAGMPRRKKVPFCVAEKPKLSNTTCCLDRLGKFPSLRLDRALFFL
jgi:hypothetical protein